MLALVGIVLVGFGAYHWVHPAYSDDDIRKSLVDTWEVSAWVTSAILSLSAILVTASVFIALYYAHARLWRPAATSILVALCAGSLAYSNHVVLTMRVAVLTGQTFGSWYGLF
jgi:glucan phosphoethanolaminetransferase (alkaline phosphatase superfamily)